MLYSAVLYSAVLYSAVLYSAVLYSAVLFSAVLFSAGCSVDEDANRGARCKTDPDCPGGSCYRGFCIASEGGDGGGTEGGTPCTAAMPCPYGGPAETIGVGACRAGERACENGVLAGACEGEVIPTDEVDCDEIDNDCDGEIDELENPTCPTGREGACGMGELVCRGTSRVCTTKVSPVGEVCNSVDDDCNGEIDDQIDQSCYAEGTAGCTPSGTDLACVGTCRPGAAQCADGVSSCEGMTGPVSELCAPPDGVTFAVDEDCDEAVDEDCPCMEGATQDCYGGPPGTESAGTCSLGTQSCSAGVFGECIEDIIPVPEICGNERDEDCNGVVDDAPGIGVPCVDDLLLGECRHGFNACTDGEVACVTTVGSSEACDGLDNDCDGTIDNGYELSSDVNNCGECGRACAAGLQCCQGICVDVRANETSCGGCGVACELGTECCNGDCANPESDRNHCGGCGIACGENQECCGGTCVDVRTSEAHCNGCDRACGEGELCCGAECSSATAPECVGCGAGCPAEASTCCDGSCTDLMGDASNCGMCGNSCSPGALCCNGTCVDQGDSNCGACGTTCDTSTSRCCNGRCTPIDEANCATCGDVCGSGQGCCDGMCINLADSPAHCGMCGRSCGGGETCTNGICCASGLLGCEGSCVNPSSDNANCGRCGNVCGGLTHCASGNCCVLC